MQIQVPHNNAIVLPSDMMQLPLLRVSWIDAARQADPTTGQDRIELGDLWMWNKVDFRRQIWHHQACSVFKRNTKNNDVKCEL